MEHGITVWRDAGGGLIVLRTRDQQQHTLVVSEEFDYENARRLETDFILSHVQLREEEPTMTPTDIREIFRKIASGKRNHGGFLTAFADAVMRADDDNFRCLLPACVYLVEKYKWNFQGEIRKRLLESYAKHR